MAGTRDLTTPRLQFRLDLTVPAQKTLYDELMTLPKGKRNTAIIERLQCRDEPDATLYAVVRKAIRDELAEDHAVPVNTRSAAELPAELFDTSQFQDE